jgi:hypothetical protein
LKKPGSGRRSLKRYEITNLLFFLTLIVALAVLVSFVFRFYGNRNQAVAEDKEKGVVSDTVSPGSDVGIFYLSTKVSDFSHQYRSRLDVPATDDGFVKDLFALPGIEEVTIDQKVIVVRKQTSVRWEGIQSGVKQIVKDHLHLHY